LADRARIFSRSLRLKVIKARSPVRSSIAGVSDFD